MNFSERMGLKPVNEVIQTSGMSDQLRNGLWNVLYGLVFSNGEVWIGEAAERLKVTHYLLYFIYLKLPVDQRSEDPSRQLDDIRQRFFNFSWNEVYDFIEFLLESSHLIPTETSTAVNNILKPELSGYRLVENRFVPITSSEEIDAIQSALSQTGIPGAAAHLSRALTLLSDKEKPDYRNSLKESISAVESAARQLTGRPKASLGDAIKELEKRRQLHPSLKEGLLKLYGYTSNEQGVRHAMQEEPNIQQSDAIFFLVMCSAFVNYLQAKSTE